jgi:hypothetical protein
VKELNLPAFFRLPELFILRVPAARCKPDAVESNRNLVENTGLEPVTSWLQTRRSPS